MEKDIAIYVKNYPDIYDRRKRTDVEHSARAQKALQQVSAAILAEKKIPIPVETVQSIWESHLRAYRQYLIRTPPAKRTDPKWSHMSFMDALLAPRKTLSSSVPCDRPKKSKPSGNAPKKSKGLKRKRSSKSPFSKYIGTPPLDEFALKHAAANRQMQSTFDDLRDTFVETQNVLRQMPSNLPDSGVFDSILAKVKMIKKEKYDECLQEVLNAVLTM